jgi:hypothetical protein
MLLAHLCRHRHSAASSLRVNLPLAGLRPERITQQQIKGRPSGRPLLIARQSDASSIASSSARQMTPGAVGFRTGAQSPSAPPP